MKHPFPPSVRSVTCICFLLIAVRCVPRSAHAYHEATSFEDKTEQDYCEDADFDSLDATENSEEDTKGEPIHDEKPVTISLLKKEGHVYVVFLLICAMVKNVRNTERIGKVNMLSE